VQAFENRMFEEIHTALAQNAQALDDRMRVDIVRLANATDGFCQQFEWLSNQALITGAGDAQIFLSLWRAYTRINHIHNDLPRSAFEVDSPGPQAKKTCLRRAMHLVTSTSCKCICFPFCK
jgi:hypothetical protein